MARSGSLLRCRRARLKISESAERDESFADFNRKGAADRKKDSAAPLDSPGPEIDCPNGQVGPWTQGNKRLLCVSQ